MQWTKVSNKYAELLFADASDSVFRTYIRLMLLVSSMEFAPNLNQICTKLGKRKVQSLLQYIEQKQREFGSDVISLDIIIQKVMEDVDAVKHKREGAKERQNKHRVTRDVTQQDKIREDKSREDNKNSMSLRDDFCNKVYQRGLNIYAILNRVKANRQNPIPDEVVINVCKKYLNKPDAVKNEWAWFVHVFNLETDQYNANRQMADHQAYKDAPVNEMVASLAQKMGG